MATVLVVDDSMFMRRMIKDIVTHAGHTVISEAANGVEAVQQYHLHQPDIVTMDITMPEMTGLQATRAIVAIYPKARIIMVSAMGQQSLITEAIQIGASGFITKPFQRDKVLQEIHCVLRSMQDI